MVTCGSLDFAVQLVNTHWVLADPPDRLSDVAAYQRILRDAGDREFAAELRSRDLDALRALRAELAPVFVAGAIEEAVGLLDPLLRSAAVPIRLAPAGRTAEWSWARTNAGSTPFARACSRPWQHTSSDTAPLASVSATPTHAAVSTSTAAAPAPADTAATSATTGPPRPPTAADTTLESSPDARHNRWPEPAKARHGRTDRGATGGA